jgi:lipopolysaccharide transport system ATP-binding protein
VGTGFNGEMTGRENIYLNGAILGMTKKEITSKIDEIIDFSGCERYIDTPVKRYSSGMTVRLAFAVAAFLEPEILIVDEVLAVGDAEFQKKAIGKMQDISKGEGRTVLFVSHNMAAVKSLCSRGIVLENGCIVFEGRVNNAVEYYITKENTRIFDNPVCRKFINESKGPKIIKCELRNNEGMNNSMFNAGEEISLELTINPDFTDKINFSVVWFITDCFNEQFAVCSSGKMNNKYYSNNITSVKCKINSSGLLPGDYTIRIVLHVPGRENFDDWNEAISFNVISHDINNTGFEYTSIWSPKTFLISEWE